VNTDATSAAPLVWLIGEQNPYGADPKYALFPLPPHAAGGRLMRVLGMQTTDYLRAFVRRNLLTADKWSVPAARAAANALLFEHPPQDKLVLLGARVAAAFGLPFRDHLCQVRRALVGATRQERHLVVVPHPSGLSREWNDPEAVPRVKAAVEELRHGTVDARPLTARAPAAG
jgi:hypothetical protein